MTCIICSLDNPLAELKCKHPICLICFSQINAFYCPCCRADVYNDLPLEIQQNITNNRKEYDKKTLRKETRELLEDAIKNCQLDSKSIQNEIEKTFILLIENYEIPLRYIPTNIRVTIKLTDEICIDANENILGVIYDKSTISKILISSICDEIKKDLDKQIESDGTDENFKEENLILSEKVRSFQFIKM